MLRVAIVDDEEIVCKRLSLVLGREDFEVEAFIMARSFLERAVQQPFDIVFLDMRLPDQNGLEVLSRIKSLHQQTEVIIVTGHGCMETAIEAIRNGAYHYITKPVNLTEIRLLAKQVQDKISMRLENIRLRETLKGDSGLTSIIGNSPAIQKLFTLIRKVAPVDCNVLIQGGSGTGKALVARAIHQLSPKRDFPFVAFNCGGFSDELINSELFGHERGAFTGATATKIGLLEAASGGTVFLDEIGEMPLAMQVKLLHVIQERQIRRVGGTTPIDLDIRVIAATNKDLKHEVEHGTFREDLFFRLNVVSISLPHLSERREDIPLLVRHFIEKYSLAFHKEVIGIRPQAMQILNNYSYPGNVRELENIIERAVALTEGEEIHASDLPGDMQQLEFDTMEGDGLPTLEEMERRYVIKVLEKTGYNKGMTAQILAIPRTTLWRKLKAYGVE
ncbi:sigma-54-dependent transcriptional regulator [Halodesulfovibrio aestuarii]|uniref:DNA-binding transcriptional response regulator, NtrC family, contains REC, AAA-type ATPase, and a Fis-type DNA-binding domains n=1 Tax=Halodesulfovibrio aestuarii TaxID=126333 RepID=A0A8G2C979_9BACT|nr:sigma-54 dependent transcriptional regulator [Halodesulfovibrio aestuarii]SHJ05020.1 DNA-binding transcriptional response regulator, NtrC family, contains REC, AAA-type ATPase, and a Fis-type DNA-binding domains [Halodesulfovibrio aestuarii]